MRIPPTGKSEPVSPASPAQPNAAAPAPPAAGTDHADLSALSRAVGGLGTGRLEEIQSAVNAGTYVVDAKELSRRIVDFYLTRVD